MLGEAIAVPESPRRRRILIVEDDFETRDAIAGLLTQEGLQVLLASDGQEGLELLRREKVDLVVLDLWLPVMDGWQFRAAQRSDSALAGVPVIVVSADPSPQAAGIHADTFLRKPLDGSQLLLAIERLLLEAERQRLAERLRETERLTMLGTITSSIAHEVNNPLTYVLGNLHLVDDLVSRGRSRVRRCRQPGAVRTVGAAAGRRAAGPGSDPGPVRPVAIDQRASRPGERAGRSADGPRGVHRHRLESDPTPSPPDQRHRGPSAGPG
jgi:DNA-binding response OmpR family regulator